MGYDHGDSFPFDFEPNGNPFGSKSKGKLSQRSYPIQFERKLNTSFLSVRLTIGGGRGCLSSRNKYRILVFDIQIHSKCGYFQNPRAVEKTAVVIYFLDEVCRWSIDW